ncbi:hypothetical protein SAMN04487848_1031 [Microbacterium sp. ru370.1]|nr:MULTISPECIES: hypothetical protein [unclassified Microbacterium]SDO46728.1 hypothetical protein SAMN04487848_1031 [Microbacterium sp. ru370.1]SIT81851.1 hypothetical protein SAMN05880579_1027 [Microbacterium sp. RU1D]
MIRPHCITHERKNRMQPLASWELPTEPISIITAEELEALTPQ